MWTQVLTALQQQVATTHKLAQQTSYSTSNQLVHLTSRLDAAQRNLHAKLQLDTGHLQQQVSGGE